MLDIHRWRKTHQYDKKDYDDYKKQFWIDDHDIISLSTHLNKSTEYFTTLSQAAMYSTSLSFSFELFCFVDILFPATTMRAISQRAIKKRTSNSLLVLLLSSLLVRVEFQRLVSICHQKKKSITRQLLLTSNQDWPLETIWRTPESEPNKNENEEWKQNCLYKWDTKLVRSCIKMWEADDLKLTATLCCFRPALCLSQ